MGIEKLADNAVRAIGASQVLTEPAAVIKELIDNALDAHATSITIEISSNTIDVIQVRDNGHGIAPDDRAMVARPNCTSKLIDMDDLRSLGGTSLGFRGQALASAAEMSGSLTISTRVEGEQVATTLKIDHQGEVIGQERASLPVGTTVRITDFIKAHPVRRQQTLKNTEKCWRKVKHTMQAYALARPHVRLSLRVLKAKNDKANWMYAPKAGGNAEDAAFKIVGAACASQCTWSVVEEQGYTMQAFLPRPDADSAKVSNIGAFMSVDSRPVSVARGILKQLLKIFRDALKNSGAGFDNVKEPFIYVSLHCPSASYDPNVEPAKDDVLFENPDIVVDMARRLFAAIYPSKVPKLDAVRVPAVLPDTNRPTQPASDDNEEDFVTSLETPVAGSSNSPPVTTGLAHAPPQAFRTPLPSSKERETLSDNDRSTQRQQTFRPNMYGCDEEDLELLDARPSTSHTEVDREELRQARNDVSISNPWVIAKMNSSRRQPVDDQGQIEAQPELEGTGEPAQRRSIHHKPTLPGWSTQGLLTPRPSSPSPPMASSDTPDHIQDMLLTKGSSMAAQQSLLPMGRYAPTDIPDHDINESAYPVRQQQPPEYDFLTAPQSNTPQGTPLGAIPSAPQRPRQNPRKQLQQTQINKPIVMPLHDQVQKEKVWFDHLENDARPKARRRGRYQQPSTEGLVQQGELGDLIDEPRPLTPPRHNRDIRDFIDAVDLPENGSAASLIERRNFKSAGRKFAESTDDSHAHTWSDENSPPVAGVLSARGFFPASELAAIEAHLGTNTADTGRTLKRRKTGESRVLHDISGNADAHGQPDGDQDAQAISDSRPSSRRRRTTDGGTSKARRTKSARLPLERVPAGQGMHGIVLNLTTSIRDVSHSAGRMEQECSLLGLNEPALDAYNAFESTPDSDEVHTITAKLHHLLHLRVSDGEMVQDLGELLKHAFDSRQTETATDGIVSLS